MLTGFPVVLLLAAALVASARGQSFEVASIRPSPPYPSGGGVNTGVQGGPGTTDPTHMRRNWASLRNIIDMAYGVQAFQVSGPGYLDSELHDIAVTVPEGATREQVKMMWRNLLVERFGFAAHVEKKLFDGRELVVARGGPRLTPTTMAVSETEEDNGTGAMQEVLKTGSLTSRGMVTMYRAGSPPTARVMAKAQPASAIASLVRGEFEEPAVDRTGLTGAYDFTFEYTPRRRGVSPAAGLDAGIDLVTAMEENLGLQVRKAKLELDYVVVEKIERVPTEN